MSLPLVVSEADWLAARKQLLADEKAMTRARDALEHQATRAADGGDRQGLRVRRRRGPRAAWSTSSRGAGSSSCSTSCSTRSGTTAARAAPPPPTRSRPACSSTCTPRDTTLAVVSRAPLAKIERLQEAQGLDVPVVLVVRERLQLRLPRDHRRVGRAGDVELPDPRRARAARDGLDRRGLFGAARLQHVPPRRRRTCSTPTRCTHGAPRCSAARTTSST